MTFDAEASGHELLFRRPVVDEQHVSVTSFGHADSLTGSHCHNPHGDTRRLLEQRQNGLKKAGIFRGGG